MTNQMQKLPFETYCPKALHDLGNDKWELIRPIWITVERWGPDDFVAYLEGVLIFGYGDTIAEAIEELRFALPDYLESLLSAEALSDPLIKELEHLQKKIKEKGK